MWAPSFLCIAFGPISHFAQFVERIKCIFPTAWIEGIFTSIKTHKSCFFFKLGIAYFFLIKTGTVECSNAAEMLATRFTFFFSFQSGRQMLMNWLRSKCTTYSRRVHAIAHNELPENKTCYFRLINELVIATVVLHASSVFYFSQKDALHPLTLLKR